MSKTWRREELLKAFKQQAAQKKPLLVASAGNGLVAKCAEIGGVDVILDVSTGITRWKGLPSIALLEDCNKLVLDLFDEINDATKTTPIFVSVEAGEPPLERDLKDMLKPFIEKGCSGIQNFPTSGEIEEEDFIKVAELDKKGTEEYQVLQSKGQDELFRQAREKESMGLGYAREIELIRTAHEMDIFTLAYVFTPRQAEKMAEAGADGIIAHCGGTAGGLVGHVTLDHKTAALKVQAMFEGAKKVNPDIILLGHGGPFATAEDTKYLYEHTDAMGFLSGSAVERIPVEKAIVDAVKEFKGTSLK